ncbi:unnamed protein product [Meloidogyne enterolobii]|uniref:Uncharacterized protein n=1 Tax=Meloidogyne enterolobii TaxID=390850 RepID=A0ACB0Z409_MELEN
MDLTSSIIPITTQNFMQNSPKEHSLYVQGGMVQRQQPHPLNDFENLNSATNGKING